MRTLLLFIKSLPRLIRNANKDMSRHPAMSLSSILSVAIALLLAMVMALLSLNVVHFANSVEGDLQIQISLSPALEEEQRQNLQTRLEALEGVQNVEYSSKEEELGKLIEEYGETFSQYENSNPLYDAFFITMSDPLIMEETSLQIEEMPGVLEVSNGGDSVTKLVNVFETIARGAWIIVLALSVLGIVLIRNTISMAIHVRSDEISIMRHVGAYRFYISTPFIIQGLIIGFWGALFPCVICSLSYLFIYYSFAGQFISQAFSLYAPTPFLWIINLLVFAAGELAGAFGSWLAVRKSLKGVR